MHPTCADNKWQQLVRHHIQAHEASPSPPKSLGWQIIVPIALCLNFRIWDHFCVHVICQRREVATLFCIATLAAKLSNLERLSQEIRSFNDGEEAGPLSPPGLSAPLDLSIARHSETCLSLLSASLAPMEVLWVASTWAV